MAAQNGNICIENPQIGDRVIVEKGFLYSGNIYKALSQDQVVSELAGVEIPKESRVWKVVMANTVRDRHNEIIPAAILQKFAAQINQKGLSLNYVHDRSYIIGKVLPKAMVNAVQGGHELVGYIAVYNDAALPTKTASGKGIAINKAIEDESLEDVSTEFAGRSNYVSPETGSSRGHWEYVIDPERPEDTEMTGLAVVPKGAQRGASVVKSIDGGDPKEKQKEINTNMYRDKFFVNEKEYAVSAKAEGTEIKTEGIEALVTDYKAAVTAKKEAETAKTKAEADLSALKTETEDIRKAYVADCVNFGKLIGETHTEDSLKALSLKDLKAKADEIRAKHDAPANHHHKAVEFQPTEAY